MATTPFSKLAYQTLQQGKGLAGLVHKDLSTRLMSLVAPEAVPSTESVPPELMSTLRSAMAKLEERDWADAEQGVYPEDLLFDARRRSPCARHKITTGGDSFPSVTLPRNGHPESWAAMLTEAMDGRSENKKGVSGDCTASHS